ncbi:MAG: inorganic pyrophosphatase [Coxiella sp. RIFCSPHIGHO2_12_FULL_42_15]|nr:MAG: inorganic pyrophosphatase [Coxiella sp. RIFCSPHIGHO2_12_FULL_42_15]
MIQVSAGHDIPNDFNVIIEIPADAGSIKYEVDKSSGLLMVDRFIPVAMHYPCNYGFVPQTLAEDGDPVDVLVMTPFPVQPGALLRVRPIGLLVMTDEAGKDSKIFALPITKACIQFANMTALEDFPKIILDRITHFFEQYKALEPGKWVKVQGWQDKKAAEQELLEGIKRYKVL